MSHKIVLASGNAGKLREFSQVFATDFQSFNVEIIPQAQLGVVDADETGLTFVENAILKARHASKQTGLPALADDSGLEIDTLRGAPGIYSARYSGQGDQANNNKVLHELKGVPLDGRSARFHCCLVYMRHELDPTPQIFHGTWDGLIAESAAGIEGFGYDPIFYVPSEKCSAAELPKERKNEISHRAQALQKLKSAWRI